MSARQNRRAVYDLGSNSTRFLLVEGPAEKFKPARVIDRGMTVTRLGEGLDEEGYLKNSRVNKVVEVLGEYERRIKDSEGEWVGGIATSACRRARNRSELFNRVEKTTGVRPKLIEGRREAELTFQGVKKALPGENRGTIIDVGGGSTEVIVFTADNVEHIYSLPLGVVGLREKHISGDCWKREFEPAVREKISSCLPTGVKFNSPLIVVGGTGTTISAYCRGLNRYNSRLVHGDVIDRKKLNDMLVDFEDEKFSSLKKIPIISDGREDVIGPGILIIDEFMKTTGSESFTVSDFGILVGLYAEVENND